MKMNIEKPEYDTVRSEGVIPVFISSLVFKGVKYVGQPSVNKKEAEQLAARAVILSILGIFPPSSTMYSRFNRGT